MAMCCYTTLYHATNSFWVSLVTTGFRGPCFYILGWKITMLLLYEKILNAALESSLSFQQVVGNYQSVAVFLIRISITAPQRSSGAIWDSTKNVGPDGLLRSLPTWAAVWFCHSKKTKSNTSPQCQLWTRYLHSFPTQNLVSCQPEGQGRSKGSREGRLHIHLLSPFSKTRHMSQSDKKTNASVSSTTILLGSESSWNMNSSVWSR